MIELTIKGLLPLGKAASGKANELAELLVKALWKSGYEVEKRAADSAQSLFNHPTGNLPASIHTEVDAAQLVAQVGTNLVYARLRELGGTVRPVRATVLHWMEGGRHLFAYETHHTGRPYLIPALKDSRSAIEEYMGKVLQDVVSDLAKASKSEGGI